MALSTDAVTRMLHSGGGKADHDRRRIAGKLNLHPFCNEILYEEMGTLDR
jgi:hypothetical protein